MQRIRAGWPSVRIDDGDGIRPVAAADALALDETAIPTLVETSTSGTLTVDVSLSSAGDTIAAGRLRLPLRPDWRWRVDLYTSASARFLECVDCAGRLALPFRRASAPGAEPDTLYVAWGGVSISPSSVY